MNSHQILVVSLISLIFFILPSFGAYLLFKKAGVPAWKALVPVYNTYVMLQIADSMKSLSSSAVQFITVPVVPYVGDPAAELSWEQPQQLAAFGRESPFFGMPVPTDVTVSRQVLAEPDATLSDRTWATLTDGTPLVTGEQ